MKNLGQVAMGVEYIIADENNIGESRSERDFVKIKHTHSAARYQIYGRGEKSNCSTNKTRQNCEAGKKVREHIRSQVHNQRKAVLRKKAPYFY
jgi:hypothetical protein